MKNKNLYIAYYSRGEFEDMDAEVYIGIDGTVDEFIAYYKKAYNDDLHEDDIDGVYTINKAMGIDGKEYNLNITFKKYD